MKKILPLIFVLALVATPAMAQKVNIDYAHEFDFDSVKTFTYVSTDETNIQGNELMAGRVSSMIRQKLIQGGLQEVKEGGDLYITYHFSAEDKTVYNTTNFGYGGAWGGYYGWGGGMGSSTTTASTFTEGTLVIDAYDGKEKKMVWRGTGTVTVKAKPEKQIKQVENILHKLGNRWDKILKGQGK